AARADGPPSLFVLAPMTELENAMADDSDQAMCSRNLGKFPAKYGVQVALTTMPIVLKAFMMRSCFSAKLGGIPSSFQSSMSIPAGFRKVTIFALAPFSA